MSYTLIGSQRSPFVRICRMLMMKNGIDFEFRVLNFLDDRHAAEEVARLTPINKVPLLLDGDRKIFDSRVIVNYLNEKHGWRKLTVDEENIVSAVYSCLDTGVILFLMKRDGFDMNTPGFFLTRQKARIPRNLEYVTDWAKSLKDPNGDDWNYASMSLFSFLYWGQARGVMNVSDYPELATFMERFANAPFVKETGF